LTVFKKQKPPEFSLRWLLYSCFNPAYLVPVYKVGKVFGWSRVCSESDSYKACPDFSSGACDRVPPKALAVAQVRKYEVYFF
jgi:hypothetical protein